MKRVVSILLGVVLAGLFLGWRAHGGTVEAFEQGCLNGDNLTAQECNCAAEAFGDALPFWRLAGTGSFRPLASMEVLQAAADEAERICVPQADG